MGAIAYLLVAAFVWTRVYVWLFRRHRRDFPRLTWDNGDRMFGIAWGGLVALGWPLSLPIFGLGRVAGFVQRTAPLERMLSRFERES